MFKYICSDCGATVDVADDECPHCAPGTVLDGDETADLTVLSQTADVAVPSGRDVGAVSERVESEVGTGGSTAVETVATRPRSGMELKGWHYLAFAGLVVVAILGAVILSGGMPALRLQAPEEAGVSPVETFAIGVRGPLEVSGIRPYYDDEYQAHVRAFVANHSKQEQSVALLVHLRVREATQQAPPLATFEVVISDPLPPNGGKEVDVNLRAMGSLESLPRWDEMRVDLEVLGGSGG